MIAVDTNVLVYAHREDSAWHVPARTAVEDLAAGGTWAIPWPCIHEFLSTITRGRTPPPTPLPVAILAVDALLKRPNLVVLAEAPGYWPVFRSLLEAGKITGPKVHDARIAALCLTNGVRELWTADRDFSRFPKLRTRNPLVSPV